MNCQAPLSPGAPASEPLRTHPGQELWAVHSCIPLPTLELDCEHEKIEVLKAYQSINTEYSNFMKSLELTKLTVLYMYL